MTTTTTSTSLYHTSNDRVEAFAALPRERRTARRERALASKVREVTEALSARRDPSTVFTYGDSGAAYDRGVMLQQVEATWYLCSR